MPYKLIDITCENCGKSVKGKRYNRIRKQRFCSIKCGTIATAPEAAKKRSRKDPWCSIPDCKRPAHSGQICLAHYKRWKRHGTYEAARKRRPHGMSVEEWFFKHVEKTNTCWLWTGKVNKKRQSYGYFYDSNQKKKIRVHHFIVGKPPKGMEWDHLCENVICVRPDHLELVTPTENRKRQWNGH